MTTVFVVVVVVDFYAADVGTQTLFLQLKSLLFNASSQHLCRAQELTGPDGLHRICAARSQLYLDVARF
jgi:hypothetical protein